ncbi:AlpA family transcriptional regulator [Pseudomonas aeruginosa]|nr:AlpA family transcriptional regulator [Pseudomonas aeruginosa]
MCRRSSVMKILRLGAVIESTGLARSTIYKLVGSGGFPKPVPLVGRSVGWVESEVQEWIKDRIAQRDLMVSSIT